MVNQLEDLAALLFRRPLYCTVLVQGIGELGDLRTWLGPLDLGLAEDFIGIGVTVVLESRSTVGARRKQVLCSSMGSARCQVFSGRPSGILQVRWCD